MARRRRVRFTGKFYMLLALMLVAVTVAVVLLLSDSGGGTLETGTMRMELAVKGIVIRDEMSVTVDKYDKVMFQTAEGAESYEGMPIARVFKWGYSDDMMQWRCFPGLRMRILRTLNCRLPRNGWPSARACLAGKATF
ncbi:MAG: hypothetical protein KIC63_06100 [Clostridium sp.]|nr:hypothetical protein [Clostridium sp.]